jgi:hypothetical protein
MIARGIRGVNRGDSQARPGPPKAEARRRRTLAELKVHTLAPPGASHVEGLHCFRIEFDDAEGRCFITSDEAQRLRQLTTGWVTRALEILSASGVGPGSEKPPPVAPD